MNSWTPWMNWGQETNTTLLYRFMYSVRPIPFWKLWAAQYRSMRWLKSLLTSLIHLLKFELAVAFGGEVGLLGIVILAHKLHSGGDERVDFSELLVHLLDELAAGLFAVGASVQFV